MSLRLRVEVSARHALEILCVYLELLSLPANVTTSWKIDLRGGLTLFGRPVCLSVAASHDPGRRETRVQGVLRRGPRRR